MVSGIENVAAAGLHYQGGTKGWWDHTLSQESYPALTSVLLMLQVATGGREGNQESVG
jgi:hypothetical protein